MSVSTSTTIHDLLHTPISQEMQTLWATVKDRGVSRNMGSVVRPVSGMSRYVARAVAKVAVDVVAVPIVGGVSVAPTVWRVVVNGIYDLQDDFDTLVGAQGLDA